MDDFGIVFLNSNNVFKKKKSFKKITFEKYNVLKTYTFKNNFRVMLYYDVYIIKKLIQKHTTIKRLSRTFRFYKVIRSASLIFNSN